MKCKNCKIQIPPGFVSAIELNKCPACGDSILSSSVYSRIEKVQQQIADLGFAPNQLLGISAALATRFTLVPLDLAGVASEDEIDSAPLPQKKARGKNQPKSLKEMEKLYEQNDPYADPDVTLEEEDADLSEEARQNLVHEFGLDKGDKRNITVKDIPKIRSEELESIMEPISSLDPIDIEPIRQSLPVDAQRAALLAKARAAKENSSHLIPQRVS